ncbi:MAG: LptF/LptG family permease [Roseibacillus sp.]|nr:LptF/LptG family permease [Roseibacillus sp.]
MLGTLAALALVPREIQAVNIHLLGFPDSDRTTLNLRPVLLGSLCFLPAIAALCYAFAGALDRYLTRQMLGAVGICSFALLVIYVLIDINDNIDKFQKAENTISFLLQYYLVTLPPVFVLLIPFGLLLGLLYSLGRLSHNREIIAMIQTGRSVARVIAPLGTVGLFLSLACLLLNYHWAPWGEGYREALIEFAKSGSKSQARNVLYVHRDAERIAHRSWLVGSFPYNYTPKDLILDVVVRSKDEDGPTSVLYAKSATWSPGSKKWAFNDAIRLDLRSRLEDGTLAEKFDTDLPNPYLVHDFPETPWQIVTPGLQEDYLGIPELRSWLQQYGGDEWSPRRSYLTQWYYRWAQPWICLVVVLLSAPLGIVFSRRGTAGGVAIAALLIGAMLLCSKTFLTLGDAGHLSPALAAWATNLLFTSIALLLFWRRLQGRPIYQTILSHTPLSNGD